MWYAHDNSPHGLSPQALCTDKAKKIETIKNVW